MILNNCHTWSVSITFPAGSPDSKGEARRWAHNDTVTVVAPSAARAIVLVETEWPTVKVWTVNHVGSRTILMVDADLTAPKESNSKEGSNG